MHLTTRWLLSLCPLLAAALLLLPAVASAGAKSSRQSSRAFRQLTYEVTSKTRREPRFERWSVTVHLDAEEGIERRIDFRFLVGADASSIPSDLPLAVVDAARGDLCEEVEVGPEGVPGLLPGVLTQRPFDGQGFDHLGRPELCVVALSGKAGVWEGVLVINRPPVSRLDHRFAMLLAVQPLAAPAELLSFQIEHGPLQDPRILPVGWDVAIRRKAIEHRRIRAFFEIERVRPLPLMPVVSISGRVPALAVTSGEDWATLANEHRAFFEAASRAKGPVIPLAGRVLGQATPLESVREAVRLALDDVALDPAGGRGGGWQLPRRASETAEIKEGTAAARAALLLALLRTAEIRAEVVLVNRSAHRVSPTEPLALLNQTLVVLPDVAIEPGGGPLFLDPSRGSAWLGALDDALLGRAGLLLSPSGARWLSLPSEPPRQQWTLNVAESPGGLLNWTLEGLLDGASAARVREWDNAGRPDGGAPASDLSWLRLDGWDQGELVVTEAAGGRLAVAASGQGLRSVLLTDGNLPVPVLPSPAPATPQDTAWPYSRDATTFRVDLLESWVFDGTVSGGTVQDGKRTTPFWQADFLASWSGPVFNRRTQLRFTKNLLAPSAAIEVERYHHLVGNSLGGVAAP